MNLKAFTCSDVTGSVGDKNLEGCSLPIRLVSDVPSFCRVVSSKLKIDRYRLNKGPVKCNELSFLFPKVGY